MDFIRSEAGNGDASERASSLAVKSPRKKGFLSRFSKKTFLLSGIGALLVISGGGLLYWKLVIWQPAVVNPFSTGIIAAMKFPLYYPTHLPTGYRIDKKSVNQPEAGVVVFDMIGPKGEKLYMSEEARPGTFDLGGFYKKFQDLKEVPVSDGSIAVGRVNSGQTEIVSRANNKTWVLSNTTANLPADQLVAMLQSITPSY
ncbi:MAG: hypothetical protein ACHQT5_00520 [Candidatus Saccharimonadales bacterium]|jgi:hypothetical protein